MIFLVMGLSAENIEERKRQTEKKHWKVKRKKNEAYEEGQITAIYIFAFKLHFAPKHNLKKVLYTIKFYLQFLCVAGYLKDSDDTPNKNMRIII